jgi:two-component system cell cycle sensor histidine kinase/response regulator CckA
MSEKKNERWDFVESIVENIPDMIFVKDATELRFVRFNRAGEELLGLPREEMYGKNDYDFFPKDEADFFTEKDREVLAGGKPVDIHEEPLHTQNGVRWLHTRKVPILGEDGAPRYLLGISTDITERRQAEQDLAEARELLRQREREALEAKLRETQRLESLGVMAGGIAHDFNNLLVPVLGNASLALETLPEDHPARAMLESISLAAQQASELTRHLLAYAGGGQVFMEPLDIAEVVGELLLILGVDTRQSVDLEVELQDHLPPIYGDSSQIRQLLLNLLTNAIDAVGDGPGVVRLRAQLMLQDDDLLDVDWTSGGPAPSQDYVLLEVEDTGCGMDPDTQQRIFDPFFSTKQSGHGLGLAAVHGIVKGHVGVLKVESDLGRGTCIGVALPVSAEPLLGMAIAEEIVMPSKVDRHLVLVVDDQALVREVARHGLEHLGCEVIEAANGAEAVQVFETHHAKVELVLLDMTMPNMSGDAVLERLFQIRQDIPVIISSGHLEQDALKRLPVDRLVGFLQKPYTLAELRQVVTRGLRTV